MYIFLSNLKACFGDCFIVIISIDTIDT